MKNIAYALALSATLSLSAASTAAETPRMSLPEVEATVSSQTDLNLSSSFGYLPIILAVGLMVVAYHAASSGYYYPVVASDARLKSDIEQVGVSPSGIPVYHFGYDGVDGRFQGVMAQDLLELAPEAVIQHETGAMIVDYSKIDVSFKILQ